jgi:hypothetical protein
MSAGRAIQSFRAAASSRGSSTGSGAGQVETGGRRADAVAGLADAPLPHYKMTDQSVSF